MMNAVAPHRSHPIPPRRGIPRRLAGALLASATVVLLSATPGLCQVATSTIGGGFNGTTIPAGSTVWFNSVFKYSGPVSGPVTIKLTNVHVTFTAGTKPYDVVVPNARIQLSPSAGPATTHYDAASNTWITSARFGLSGNLWLDGVGLNVPAGLPAGIRPVSWRANFTTDGPTVSLNWQWAAAVYRTFSTDLNALNVKPCDDSHGSIYLNSDHAGTPEAFTNRVIGGATVGGATGGGASNYTGSYSPTATVKFGPCLGPQPTSTISGPDSLCANGAAQLCGPSAPLGATFTYLWTTGETTRCITINGPGTYGLTVSTACASSSSSKTIRQLTPVACGITGPSTICAGQPTQICGPDGAGLTYRWSTGATTRCISVTAQATYTLTVSGGCGGPTTCSKALLASSPPVCTITGPDTLCPSQTAQLCGSEAFQGTMYSYLWSTGATTRCITIRDAGTYTLTVSTPTCGSATCSKTVVMGTAVACTIQGPADIDPDSTASLCGPKGDGLTYLWSTGETTRCITINTPGTYGLTVTSPSCGSSTCALTVLDRPTSSCRCSFFYPDSSHLPRSMQPYNESGIVRAIVPGRNGCPVGDMKLKVWYNDEWPLNLGVRRVVVYTSPTDSTITDYPVTMSPATPSCVTNLSFGDTLQTGLMSGTDTAVDGGRPMWPVLYLTDITFDKYARNGDWEQGAVGAIPADQVCGLWTASVRRVYTYLGNKVTIAKDLYPTPTPANHWNLGANGDVPPGGFASYLDEGYGAEITWDLTKLPLEPGHRYRLYTIVHDGDQQVPAGGDVGHGCTRVVVPVQGFPAPTAALATHPAPEMPAAFGAPITFALSQNVPNPFHTGSSTAISFALPERSEVKVAIYSIAGQRVATLANSTFESGRRTLVWSGRNDNNQPLMPGMYVCKMDAVAAGTHRFVQVRKMMMIQ